MRALLALLKKELLVELRAKETLASIMSLSLLLAVVVAFGVNGAFLTAEQILKIAPLLIWLVFIFSATVSLERLYEHEINNRALDGLILTGVPPALIFCSKLVAGLLLSLIGFMTGLGGLIILLDLAITQLMVPLTIIAFLVLFAYCSLALLLAVLSVSSRLKGMLLPLIMLPLLFPVLFCALELSSELFANHRLDLHSSWFSLLICLDLVYFLLGLNLFEYAVKE